MTRYVNITIITLIIHRRKIRRDDGGVRQVVINYVKRLQSSCMYELNHFNVAVGKICPLMD